MTKLSRFTICQILGCALCLAIAVCGVARAQVKPAAGAIPTVQDFQVTRSTDDPPNTVRVNGHLAHASRLLVGASVAAATPAASPSVLSVIGETERDFENIPNLQTFQLAPLGPGQSAAQSDDAMVKRYETAVNSLQALGQFRWVEPDYLLFPSATPTDSAFTDGTLWGLQNVGQNNGVAGADINAVPAWDVTTGSPNVIVAIIDSGLRTSHTDLSPNLWENPDEIPGNGLDDDANGFIDDIHGIDAQNNTGTPTPSSSHGTHVAGTIGAAANAGGAHVGVAWNVRLMGLKFLGAQFGSTSDAITCINYAIAKGAHIINASWGGGGRSNALFNAIQAANQAGILFVAAAGNDGLDNDVFPFYPAGFDLSNILSVAALDRSDQLASFSNFGATSVDIGAPGVQIFSTTASGDTAYGFLSGTSMASPHVAGVAALIKSHFPNLSPAAMITRLLGTAAPVAALSGKAVTEGRIDAHQALIATGDGNLEIQLSTSQDPLIANTSVNIFASVTDIDPVSNATITARFLPPTPEALSPGSAATLLDNGTAPDNTAGDAIYSGSLTVPPTANQQTLEVTASAAEKNQTTATLTLNVVMPPSNDNFAQRTMLPVGSTRATSHNLGATGEPGEPFNPRTSVGPGEASAWWTWTAPSSEVVSIDTFGSDFDTTLAVYRGGALNQLELIGSNDDSGSQDSLVRFVATAGVDYHLQVDGFGGAQGNIVLNYPEVILPTGHARVVLPPNSVHAEQGQDTSLSVETTGAAPVHIQWFHDGLSLPGANAKTLTISSAQPSDAGLYSAEVSNDQGHEFSRSVPVAIHHIGSPPSNDEFAAATQLEATTGTAIGTNVNASAETNEPNHANESAPIRSVWWQWQAPANGTLQVRTFGSDFDTVLAVYEGTSIDALTSIAGNDDAALPRFPQSEITTLTSAGTTYHLAVAGKNGATGNIRLDYGFTEHPDSYLANGSFESGNLIGWTLSDFTNPSSAAQSQLATILIEPLLPFSTVQPIDGYFAFAHGFAADTPSTLTLAQAATLDVAGLSLVLNYRAGWTFLNNPAPTQPRTFSVRVEPVSGGTPLAAETILTTDLTSNANTGPQTVVIPLNNSAGQEVSIALDWLVPEAGTGPGFFELDQVRLIQGCIAVPILTYSVGSLPSDVTTGDHFHSLPTNDTRGEAEVGRYQSEEVRGIVQFDLSNLDQVTEATLSYRVLADGGSFTGVNDQGFDGAIILESFSPVTPHSPSTADYQASSHELIDTLNTSQLEIDDSVSLDLTTLINRQITNGANAIGIRIRAHPLPAENEGAWTLGDFRLVLDQRVTIPDPALKQSIRNTLEISTQSLKTTDMANLTSLSVPDAKLTSLVGLEHALNLTSLDLRGNNLTDLAPIAALTQLRDQAQPGLRVENNLLDISPNSVQRGIIDTLDQITGLTVTFRPQRLIDTDLDGLDDRFEQRIINANPNDGIATLGDVLPDDDFDGDLRTNREEFRRFSDPTNPTQFGKAGDVDRDNNLTILDLIRLNNHLRSHHLLDEDARPFGDFDLNDLLDHRDRDLLRGLLLSPSP